VRHYEIVVIIHPDQRDQLPAMLQRYTSIVESSGGKIHRQEDWGRRQLAYPIQKLHKANYILLNVECSKEALEELELGFRFNDAVLRNLIVTCDQPITEPSSILQASEKREKEYAEKREHSNSSRDRKTGDKPAAAKEDNTPATSESTDSEATEAKVEPTKPAATEAKVEPTKPADAAE
jgi:small subunit ribosomal protein S6